MMSSVLPVYSRSSIEIEKGEGSFLYSKDGRKFIDFVSGIAVNCLGHCHPKLIKSLNEQSEKLWHISNIFDIPGLEDFANILTSNTFADNVFFCSSGAEANECCIKMIRKYQNSVNSNRYKIITFTGGFHGRTLAALWASKRDLLMQEGFGPPVEGFINVEFNNIQAVKDAIDDQTAAILVEPIQGDGGIRPTNDGYLKELRKIADENDILLCFDEIQCGMGRSGSLYSYMDYGVEPDILTSAKGIGGGFPLGACLATKKASQGMTLGTHGSTYGGNPLAMAVGKTVIEEILSEGFLDNVKNNGKYLFGKLEDIAVKYPNIIDEIRGYGLILGIKTKILNKDFISKLADNGLLTPAASDNIVRLLPPLNVTKDVIDEALKIIENTCEQLK